MENNTNEANLNQERSLGLIPMVAFSVGCCLASGVFAIPGDFANSGAYTLASLLGWLVAGVGMLSLMMSYFNLSIAKPELTSGLYTYSKAGFGEYVGFNAAWGYWLSAILAYVTFQVGLFGSLSEVIPWLESGSSIKSLILGSIILWLLVLLVLRGVNQAVVLNVIIVIAKALPILFMVIAAIVGNAFSFETFMANWNDPSGTPVLKQVVSTCFVTVWCFIGIEGAVVISHRAKTTRTAGAGATISFLCLLGLYFLISFLSMGVADHDTLASYTENYTFSMAGVMEQIVGHWGAVLVNVAAIISIGLALFTYVILCVDSLAGPAENDCFPAKFNERNKNNAPTMSIIGSAVVIQVFIVIATFANSSFQNCYYLSTVAIVIPYMLSMFFAVKTAVRGELTVGQSGINKVFTWAFALLGGAYGCWMFYATCISDPYVLIAALLFFPGIIVYVIKRKGAGEKIFPKTYDAVIAAAMAVLFVVAIYLVASGNEMVTGILA